MALIGMKKKGSSKIDFLEEASFEKDNKEDDLHKILEENPLLIVSEIFDTKVVLLKSKFLFSSGDEADMVLCDATGDLVIVELKRGRAPRDSIAQLMDYASQISKMSIEELLVQTRFRDISEVITEFGVDVNENKENFEETFKKSMDSPRLMLVSYDIPDDIKRVAKWLRTKGIMINCVEFDYFASGENELFVPKVIGSDETAQIMAESFTKAEKLNFDYTSLLIRAFKDKKPGITNREGTHGNWMGLPAGYNDVHFEWHLKGRRPNKEIQVCLDFENDDKNINQQRLEQFKQMERQFEEKIGEKLDFIPHGRNWMRVCAKRPVETLEKAKEDDNLNWAVNTMVKFYEVLKPELDRIMAK